MKLGLDTNTPLLTQCPGTLAHMAEHLGDDDWSHLGPDWEMEEATRKLLLKTQFAFALVPRIFAIIFLMEFIL